jgi:hypothetical protein
VCLSGEVIGWLFNAKISISFSYDHVGFLQHSFVLVKNCKLAVLDLVGSGEWFLQFTKFCMAKVFVGVYFLCCLFKAIFKALGG